MSGNGNFYPGSQIWRVLEVQHKIQSLAVKRCMYFIVIDKKNEDRRFKLNRPEPWLHWTSHRPPTSTQ